MMDSMHNMSGRGNSGQVGTASNVRPRMAIIFLVIWILFQMSRITAYPIVQDVRAGVDSAAWLFPALTDIFIGITAPFLAYALLRKTGLGVWTAAIAWFALSISDHIDAFVTGLTVPAARSMSGGIIPVLVVLTALDVVALVVLTRVKVKSYYLRAFRSASQV